MKMDELREIINHSDMVLIGIGREMSVLKNYIPDMLIQVNEDREENDTIMQYFQALYCNNEDRILDKSYQNLFNLVRDKNYFIVTTNMDDKIWDTDFDKTRIVAPCGGFRYMQCENNCNHELYDSDQFLKNAEEFRRIYSDDLFLKEFKTPKCPKCGSNLVFCNKNVKNYNEKIYLSQWEVYTAWMQKTLNKKVCILELGEGLKYPTVIRWPFEKIAFLNQKAVLIRIHSKLYQLTEELKERAYSIPSDPIAFLKNE